jgi:aminopeptidase N
MLRGVVGEEAFSRGIKSYYKKYLNANATTTDFRKAMEEASGQNLKIFFEQWLCKPGALKLNGSWKFDPRKKEVKIELDQVQTDGSLFQMPLQIGIYLPGNTQPLMKTVDVKEKKNQFAVAVDSAPDKIVLDPNSWVLMDATFVKK